MFHQIMRVSLLGLRSHVLKARWCLEGSSGQTWGTLNVLVPQIIISHYCDE